MVALDRKIDPALAEPSGLAGLLAGQDISITRGQPSLPAESQVSGEPLDGSDHDFESADKRREATRRRLVAEHTPVGLFEESLVRELANLMIDLDDYRAGREAARRATIATYREIYGELDCLSPHQHPATAGSPPVAGTTPTSDAVLTAALIGRPIVRAEQQIARTVKMINQVSSHLGKLQGERRLRELPRLAACAGITIDVVSRPEAPLAIASHLAQAETRDPGPAAETQGGLAVAETEADCEQIFRKWLRTARLPCPQCGSREPVLELKNRRVLQCRCCGGQRGLKTGTLFAQSNVSFLAAFRAIRLLAHEQQIPLGNLCRATGLSAKSMRTLRSRILQALGDPAHRGSLLAACGYRSEQVLPT